MLFLDNRMLVCLLVRLSILSERTSHLGAGWSCGVLSETPSCKLNNLWLDNINCLFQLLH